MVIDLRLTNNGSLQRFVFVYDGLNRRIKDGTTDVYFNTSWQVVEKLNAANQTVTQKVWSVVYVDAMVEQDRDTDADGTLDQRLYPTQDAKFLSRGYGFWRPPLDNVSHSLISILGLEKFGFWIDIAGRIVPSVLREN